MRKGKSFAEILGDVGMEQKRKVALKLPSWDGVEGLEVPSKLALEQCSSESAALYKASLAARVIGEKAEIADLNSGLGVDVWAFAAKGRKVWYNEIDAELEGAAQRNFKRLGLDNVECSCMDAAERLASLPKVDMIYLDPARRNGAGRKVFLLEDCSPNVIDLLPELWLHSDCVMLKLSPMADISMVAQRLEGLCEVHIVGAAGECKELLCVVRKGWSGPYKTIVAELSGNGVDTAELGEASVRLCGEQPREGELLLEPSASLVKSGKYGAICENFALSQLDRFTHLYIPDSAECPENAFFKRFRIVENAAFNKAEMKRIAGLYPKADVSAKNVPLSSDELKKKMGIAGSGEAHIFGVSVLGERRLLVCEKVTGPESVV